MTLLKETERLVGKLSYPEKEQLFNWLAHDLRRAFPGVEQTPDVCGGAPRISGTRIPVWTLVRYQQLGMSDEQLLQMYPTLQASDLDNAWRYYQQHQTAINEQIVENEIE